MRGRDTGHADMRFTLMLASWRAGHDADNAAASVELLFLD